MLRKSLLSVVLALAAAPVGAQINNPADKQRPSNQFIPTQGNAITVEGRSVSSLRDEDRIGPYQQPRWTARRLFGETRIYVRPPGIAEFEFWLQPEVKDKHTETRKMYEFEFGLGYRTQLDLYIVSHKDGGEGSETFDEQKFEIRHALADWDAIWGNPTLYLEWSSKSDAPDAIEGKLLLGGEITTGWHWGTNFVFEHEMGGMQENVWEITAGVSKTLVDERFAFGIEAKGALIDDKTTRGHYTDELLIGPTLQFRPVPQAHIDLAILPGLTKDSPDLKVTLIFGWMF
ncbi:MAG: hypothetical protein KDC87_18635 [Planctomycetes bacterium]|nr:hypothetical protein [Planctomycetota bacterium]MCB9869332.1 hypothetical protein [Planctomycetota bacterium]